MNRNWKFYLTWKVGSVAEAESKRREKRKKKKKAPKQSPLDSIQGKIKIKIKERQKAKAKRERALQQISVSPVSCSNKPCPYRSRTGSLSGICIYFDLFFLLVLNARIFVFCVLFLDSDLCEEIAVFVDCFDVVGEVDDWFVWWRLGRNECVFCLLV